MVGFHFQVVDSVDAGEGAYGFDDHVSVFGAEAFSGLQFMGGDPVSLSSEYSLW